MAGRLVGWVGWGGIIIIIIVITIIIIHASLTFGWFDVPPHSNTKKKLGFRAYKGLWKGQKFI